jgi:aspartokinase-like uncharacterized kinase
MNAEKIDATLRVVKLGGSLLDWPEFPGQLRRWLDCQPAACNLMLIGGGDLVEAIRKLDGMHGLGEKSAHWHCIRSLHITAAIFCNLFPDASPTAHELANCRSGLHLLDAEGIMKEDQKRSARPLPETWDVTTDSIAARAAVLYGVTELVLLKSKLPDRTGGLRSLAEVGYVDAHFPVCAKSLPKIRFVNLRDPDFGERELAGDGR